MSNGSVKAVISRLPSLSPYARQFLKSQPLAAEQPIRAELFGLQRFEQHGTSLAQAQAVADQADSRRLAAFFPRVKENIVALQSSYDYISATSHSGHYVTPAAEWLLDNFHLVEAQLDQIRDGVPARYYRDLPKLKSAPLEGLPRVYGIAWAYVAHTDSVLNIETFSAFLNSYQEIHELQLAELWALPTTLRVVLLENLRRLSDSIAFSKVAREVAHAVWDSADALDAQALDWLDRRMQQRGVQRAYLTQLWQRIPTDSPQEALPLMKWVERHCADGAALTVESQNAQVSSNLTVSNIITTLRLIGQVEWVDLLEPLSRPLHVLQGLPSFERESELTRKQITHAMERLARRNGKSEREVAAALLATAAKAEAGEPVTQTAGYYLLGPGQQALAQTLSVANSGSSRRAVGWWRLPAYAAVIAAGTLALLLAASHQVSGDAWVWWVSVALLLVPASETAASFIHRLLAESLKIHLLPRLDFSAGIPQEHRVLVAMPALLTSAASIDRLVARLELHWLANREQQAQFALVSDWADAPSEHLPEDEPLLERARAAIVMLNERHGPHATGGARFLLLHRPRMWCETQQCWMGWERKRGKLEQLIRLLATGDAGGFLPVAAAQRPLAQTPYLVTLDSDTGLPTGALRELASIAAHPLNTPHVDPASRCVTAGYGILQPRVVTPLADERDRSWFRSLFAGHCGIDPYSNGASDIYQDLFGTGSFTGKGLLNVRALHATLDSRLPDGAILSHDLLEGSLARCGHVSDVVLVEGYPSHSTVAASRLHRWTRGDWQLIPLMARARHWGIDLLGLWKMSDNLRRSLVAPACVALFLWTIFGDALPLRTAALMTAATLLAGPLLGALAGLVPQRRGIAWRHFFNVGTRQLLLTLGAAAWQFVTLARQAHLQLDAIVRTLWRLVRRRKLLQWTTAEQAEAAAQGTLASFVRAEAFTSATCLVLAAVSAWQAEQPELGVTLLLLWSLSPVAAWWSSRTWHAAPGHALAEDERAYLEQVARDTWRFFERCVTVQDNYLPPDNLQTVPQATLAHRTSPTNIGLYLLAIHCALEFGWITLTEAASRLQETLDSVERLPTHHGHLLNWYDTQSLAVLQPAYVSTVDSGNFAGLLIAVAQASIAAAPAGAGGDAMRAVARRCQALHDAMNFGPLYDARRHLFHIGLRVNEDELDAGYYDLLASEARLTSYLAIAKGDVSRRHWTALGRPFLSVNAQPGLKSWSGSMFEYLMPSLLMCEPAGGLLQAAARSAIAEQRAFADAHALPWGVSESAYFAQDHTLAFQYGPFGMARLALRRTPVADKVVAPYATLMAAMFEPRAAIANLKRLEALGGRGELGFYEALDFTTSRQPADRQFSLVETFMAHHHGMSLASLCNLLRGDAPRRWFNAAPLVLAHEMLLHENTPRQIARAADPRPIPESAYSTELQSSQARDVQPIAPGWKPTQLLSNGRYSVALRPNGAGLSRWQGRHVSRWRDDVLRDGYGTFFYLRLPGHAPAVSLTSTPAPGPGWQYSARFMADRVQFSAEGSHITSTVTVVVSPEDDTELRTIVLHNTGAEDLDVELLSCFEPVLTDPRADEAHPAFSGMFLQSQWHPGSRAVILTRRPRLQGDSQMAVAHMLASVEAQHGDISCVADRRSFYGRNRSANNPALNRSAVQADGTPVNELDPLASLRVALHLPAGGTARLCFATLAADTADALAGRIDQYLQPVHVQRALMMAATLAQVRLRDLALRPDENAALQDLTTALMYSAPREGAGMQPMDQRLLWRFGISGDKPIVLVRIHSNNGVPLVHALLRAQPWWIFGGQAVDVVVLNGELNSYLMPLQRDILALRDRLRQTVQQSFPSAETGGFYLLREQEVTQPEQDALTAQARVVLGADGRSLELRVASWLEGAPVVRGDAAPERPAPAAPSATVAQGSAGAVAGEFDPASGEFRFVLRAGQCTPRPWINVIANPDFGFQVSERGSGYTWAGNSRLHQLTRWSNDSVQDPASEHWMVQDLDTRSLLSPTPAAASRTGHRHAVRHGQGYTVFETEQQNLALVTTFFADIKRQAKLVRIEVRNMGTSRRRQRAKGLCEWMMGQNLVDRRGVHTWKAPDSSAVFAMQRESRAGFGGNTAFLALASGARPTHWSCDRAEFFDHAGRLVWPDVWSRQAGSMDPAAALARDFDLDAGQTAVVCFVVGHAANQHDAAALARQLSAEDGAQALLDAQGHWQRLLGRVRVHTPDPAFDALVNHWLIYQTVTCRLWAKAGFYQAGGASGFRDQLQDAMALATIDPARLRAQIVLNASRQFPQGDVQHWWHAPGGEGVRTHFSDDLLWLPYAAAHYVQVTGDHSLLGETVPFIDGPQIPDGAEDAYYAPQPSSERASVYEHCARAIERSLRTGAHGLPLMGTGDWNDGMNRVGHEGRGESVWLAWFLCSVTERFAPIAQAQGDDARAAHWLQARDGWVTALHQAGWDGAWFRRAFFDNGEPLGSSSNEECRIDLIAQAWSVLSGASTPAYTRPAMQSMKQQLIDRDAGLLRLLDPPLQHAANNPGYIQAYPPGVRENGGQYSHGAVWALMAQALSGDTEGAWESFQALSPAHRSQQPDRAVRYEIEPYVMAGDIYSAPPYTGRGGWSWYTGSAAWLYRAAIETLIGLYLRHDGFSLSPRVPAHWPSFEVIIALPGREARVRWSRNNAAVEPAQSHTRLAWGEWTPFADLPQGAVVVVTGCDDDGDGNPAAGTETAPAPAPASAASAEPLDN